MNRDKRIIIITGASSGIGAATAKLFADQDRSHVIVSDINKRLGEAVVNEMIADGKSAEYLNCDVSEYKQVEAMIQCVIEQHGQLDVLVNNAGIANKQMLRTAEFALEDWENVIAINQTGVFYCMKYALQQMMKQGFGNIVNVASLAGLKASGNCISYTASKFAVVGMTKSAALEYAAKNIRINAVCPGYTHSALLENMFEEKPELEKRLLNFIPVKRFGQASEIAEAILWLASDKTKFITGQCITLDGGLSL
ncbi:UNVERIFIED_CONTAM: hypothetical protein GTU68_052792 [Idotea baltica]|nr:hypothetical protein [Idotea baltica]